MAVSGVVGGIYTANGTSTAFSQKPLTNGGDNKVYTITDTTMKYWDRSAPVTVERSPNGTTWTVLTSGFSIEHCGGQIVFSVANAPADQIRVSGKYFTPVKVAGGFNWNVDIEVDTLEATVFENNGWKSFIPSTKGFSGTFETYWLDNTDYAAKMGDVNLILILYTDIGPSKKRYEGYATITKESISTPNEDLVTDNLDFQGGGKLYYREG